MKWPNDVLIAERKVAGILSEYIAGPNGGRAVIGMGINTSMTADRLPVPEATSVLVESGRMVDDDELVVGSCATSTSNWRCGRRAWTSCSPSTGASA